MQSDALIFIVILNFNGYEDTIECVKSVNNLDYSNYEIVIVDNNSDSDEFEKLKTQFPQHEVINNSFNGGYANGNNIGIQFAISKKADYICVLNNDTVVTKDLLSRLVKRFDEIHNLGVIGPAILDYKIKHLIQSTGAKINFLYGKVPPLNEGLVYQSLDEGLIECDYIGGACMLFKVDLVNKIGLIPENYFLFFEETEWCHLAKINNYKIYCDSEAVIYHKGSSSIKKYQGLSHYFMNRNRVVFVKRNVGSLKFVFFSIYLLMETLVFSILKGFNREKIKAYLDGFKNVVDTKYLPQQEEIYEN